VKGTGISTSQVYRALAALVEKTLVTATVHAEGKQFTTNPPQTLLALHDERRADIEALAQKLTKLQPSTPSHTETIVFEGIRGFKLAFQKIITDCREGGEIYILGFSEQLYRSRDLRIFLKNANARSREKKHKLKILLPEDTRKTLGKDREKESNTAVRYMPNGFISPAAVDVFDNWVYTFVWDEQPYVFAIRNTRIASSYRNYFRFLWKTAKQPNRR
jgi:sugar-specific transcriptional regulator TrmB